jgi:hypothetical protein
MKRLQKTVLALAACALLSAPALADTQSKTVEFSKDLKVGSTVVKRGKYKVRFDEQTNELVVLSGDKVVARSAARLEERESKSKYTSVYSSVKGEDGADRLLSVNMGGKHAVIGDAAASAR